VSPAAPASPPPFREFVMSLGGADTVAAKGDKKAKVTLVEFSDYECGYCARHVKQTLPEIEKQYVKTGKLRYVFRDFPIASHKLAPKAHEAAACAGDQGKYWEMHDRLFANQTALAATALPIHAEVLGLDVRAFKACLDGGKHAERVRKNLADGRAAGVTGTPAYFLGLTDSDESRLRVTKMIRGAKTYAFFKDAIETLLAQN
jgi:protein-disulfide isomerase